MDWIRQNKFLTAYIATLAVGIGVLGYLLYSSYSKYTEVAQSYNLGVAELHRLQGLEPFPDQNSQKKLDDLRKAYAAGVTDLQVKLAAYEPAPESPALTPILFQDKLRRVVDEVSQSAHSAHVALPDGFYLGFEQYRGVPPDAGAAPALSRELDVIRDLVDILILHRIDSLNSIKRAPLPQEAGEKAATIAAPAAGRPGPGAKPGPAAAISVARFPVEIAFSGQPSSFRDSLDDITSSKRLMLVRALQMKNQMDHGPAREGADAPAGSAPRLEGAPAPAGQPAKSGLHYVVGLEKLDVDLRVELIRVNPPNTSGAH